MDAESPGDEFNEQTFQELLKTSTLPDDLKSSVSGRFNSEVEAQELWESAYVWLKVFGTHLNLEELDGVTAADDYSAALAGVDRGFHVSGAPQPTQDEFGAGFAMTLPVIRDGAMKSHIVLHAGFFRMLVDTDAEFHKEAVHTLCHEAAHAHDHLMQSRAFPGLYGTQIPDYRDGVLFNLAIGCWGEYIASRLSASWATPDYCEKYETAICSMLRSARVRGNSVLDNFSSPGEIERTVNELVGVYGVLLTRSSYLVGQIHGENRTIEDAAPILDALVRHTHWFSPLFNEYVSCLSELYAEYGHWSGTEVFDPLKKLFERVLNAGGMYFRLLPDGTYYVGLNKPSDS